MEWTVVSYIPNDEKEKWKKDLKPIIIEIDRLEDGAKIVGFKQEVANILEEKQLIYSLNN
jgi:hypothetical protein